MREKDFKDLKAVFEWAKRRVVNDEHLGDWLVQLGAELVALGVKENRELRS